MINKNILFNSLKDKQQKSFNGEENMYDYLIVGAGLSGAIFAHEATKQGKK